MRDEGTACDRERSDESALASACSSSGSPGLIAPADGHRCGRPCHGSLWRRCSRGSQSTRLLGCRGGCLAVVLLRLPSRRERRAARPLGSAIAPSLARRSCARVIAGEVCSVVAPFSFVRGIWRGRSLRPCSCGSELARVGPAVSGARKLSRSRYRPGRATVPPARRSARLDLPVARASGRTRTSRSALRPLFRVAACPSRSRAGCLADQ